MSRWKDDLFSNSSERKVQMRFVFGERKNSWWVSVWSFDQAIDYNLMWWYRCWLSSELSRNSFVSSSRSLLNVLVDFTLISIRRSKKIWVESLDSLSHRLRSRVSYVSFLSNETLTDMTFSFSFENEQSSSFVSSLYVITIKILFSISMSMSAVSASASVSCFEFASILLSIFNYENLFVIYFELRFLKTLMTQASAQVDIVRNEVRDLKHSVNGLQQCNEDQKRENDQVAANMRSSHSAVSRFSSLVEITRFYFVALVAGFSFRFHQRTSRNQIFAPAQIKKPTGSLMSSQQLAMQLDEFGSSPWMGGWVLRRVDWCWDHDSVIDISTYLGGWLWDVCS